MTSNWKRFLNFLAYLSYIFQCLTLMNQHMKGDRIQQIYRGYLFVCV
jgi:hypothetical protein